MIPPTGAEPSVCEWPWGSRRLGGKSLKSKNIKSGAGNIKADEREVKLKLSLRVDVGDSKIPDPPVLF